MRTFKLAALVLAVIAAGVCGNPSRPSETASDLVITGPAAVLMGLPATYSATVTFGDGRQRTATATWTSSNPQVALVDNSTGRFEGRAHGSTVLTASFLGSQASKTVQVVNNYVGNWSGRYVARACTTEGHDRDGACRAAVGSEAELNLRLSQTGEAFRDIQGSMDLGGTLAFRVPIRGNVTNDGRLNLDGTFEFMDWYGYGVCCWLEIRGWDTRLIDADAMRGVWTQRLTDIYFTGSTSMESEIVALTRGPVRITP